MTSRRSTSSCRAATRAVRALCFACSASVQQADDDDGEGERWAAVVVLGVSIFRHSTSLEMGERPLSSNARTARAPTVPTRFAAQGCVYPLACRVSRITLMMQVGVSSAVAASR